MIHGSILHIPPIFCFSTMNRPYPWVREETLGQKCSESVSHSFIFWFCNTVSLSGLFLWLYLFVLIEICTLYARDRALPSAKCLCIVITKMPVIRYDYLLRKCLKIHSAATGFPGLRYEKTNSCVDHSLE